MEEKKYFKISLGTAILITIIIILIIALVGMYFYFNPKKSENNDVASNNKVPTVMNNNVELNKITENNSTRDIPSYDEVDKIAQELFEKGSKKITELISTDFPNYEEASPREEKRMNNKHYFKTTELYSNVEKEYSKLFTEDALKNVLNMRFADIDGVLYASVGGSSGWDITNLEVTRISESSDEIEYIAKYNNVYINGTSFEQESCKMTIKLVNGTYKISQIDYCDIDKIENDIYGYVLMEYLPGDGSFKEFYRIVELHKNGNDKILAKYDVIKRDSIDKPNRIFGMKIVNNKLYYQLYYSSTDTGILTYNNIMCIDLNSEDKKAIEILTWKQDENKYQSTLRDYKITDENIYFNTLDYDYYKYNIATKEYKESSETEYNLVLEKKENDRFYLDELYIKGKRLNIDKENGRLLYDNKVIYSSGAGELEILYTFDNKIVFSVATYRTEKDYDIKYYEYDDNKEKYEEIEFRSESLYFTKNFINKI